MARRLQLVLLAAIVMATSAPSSLADEAFPRGQLPDDVRPQRYRLHLEVDPRKEQFSGVAEIAVLVTRPVRTIWLHGLGLQVREVTVEAAVPALTAIYEEVDPVSGVARVSLSGDLPAGRATIRFNYTGAFREGAEGLYRTKAGDDWYVFSQLEATDARRVFPSFDEPRFKVPFELTVIADSGDRVVANAPLRSTRPASDDRVIHEFEATPPLPTYLFALAVGPLDIVEAALPPNAVRSTPVPLRGIATKGKGPRLAYALANTPSIVASLEDYFDIPFPYAKLDLIASPNHAGAMENAGAIIFEDSYILLGDDAPPTQQRNFFEIAAHEIAHQWFGDLVTPTWWDDIWLNESFAEWMGFKVADELRPDLNIHADLVDEATYAMDVDSKRAGRPIHQLVTDNIQISSTFDAITYQKGAGVLSMFESYLGEETFRRGVQLHLRSHQNANATSDDFFAAFSEVAKQPAIIAAFHSFVDQPGVPLVSLQPAQGRTDDWQIAQDRYRPLGSTLEGDPLWQVPLCVEAYAGDSSSKVCTLLTQRLGTLTVPAGETALMPNAGGAGYYRFALDEPTLDALIAIAPQLPGSEAIMLADSIAAGFRSGKLSFARFLSAAQALSMNPSRLASIHLGWELVDIKDRWADPKTRAALAERIRDLYARRLEEVGLDLRHGAYADDPAERRLLRRSLATLVALYGRDAGLRARLADTARASLTNAAAMDPEFRSLAWSVGVQELGDSFAKSLESTMLASQDSLLRSDAAVALGAADGRATSKRALALSINPDVHTPELFRIVYGQFQLPETRNDAWTWFSLNLDRVLHRLPNYARDVAFGVVEPFCDVAHRREAGRTLTAKARALGTGMLELQRAIEGIDLCVAQRAALGQSVAAAMAQH